MRRPCVRFAHTPARKLNASSMQGARAAPGEKDVARERYSFAASMISCDMVFT